MKFDDRRPRIRLRRRRPFLRGADAPFEDVGLQEATSGDVLHVGTIEQPSLASYVSLLVARAQHSGEELLRAGAERLSEPGFVLQGILECVKPFEHGTVRLEESIARPRL